MKEGNEKFLRIEKNSAEARGRLEVSGLILLKVLNSKTIWLLVLILAAYLGVISTDGLHMLVEKVFGSAIDP